MAESAGDVLSDQQPSQVKRIPGSETTLSGSITRTNDKTFCIFNRFILLIGTPVKKNIMATITNSLPPVSPGDFSGLKPALKIFSSTEGITDSVIFSGQVPEIINQPNYQRAPEAL